MNDETEILKYFLGFSACLIFGTIFFKVFKKLKKSQVSLRDEEKGISESSVNSGYNHHRQNIDSLSKQWKNDIFLNFNSTTYHNRTESTATVYTVGQTLALPGYLQLRLDIDFKCIDLLNEGGHCLLFIGELENKTVIEQNNGHTSCIVKTFACEDKEILDSFKQEIAITFFFQKSFHFVQLLGYCLEPQMIVLKHYELGSLKKAIDEKTFKETEWITLRFNFICDIANALAEMHHSGICHNDIKPANVLLDKNISGDLVCVLCDFGIATVLDEDLLRVKALRRSKITGASLAYASPDTLMSFRNSDDNSSVIFPKANDIYSFGITIFESLTRERAWNTNMASCRDVGETVTSHKEE